MSDPTEARPPAAGDAAEVPAGRPAPIEVDLPGRRRLLAMLGAGGLSYCYQCGACVGDCPSARFHPGFNPREIMLTALVGALDRLIGPDSVIWQCSNCYNCYERCPQDVRPVEVIIALKNLARLEGRAPADVRGVYETILRTGRSAPVIGGLDRKRAALGLPPLARVDVAELAAILAPDDDGSGAGPDAAAARAGTDPERGGNPGGRAEERA